MAHPPSLPRGVGPRVYVALSGGGAKGIMHIGALKALEDQKAQFKGLSGTSIGSVIAALKAAGYTADEIANPNTNESLMEKIAGIEPGVRRPTDFFGWGRWPLIWSLRFAIRNLGFVILAVIALLAYPGFALWVVGRNPFTAPVLLWLWIVGAIAALLVLTALLGGLGSLSRFKRVLNRLLQEKCFIRSQIERFI
ncbi:MAG: hypothetical protein CGW95_09645 [Phenylobacterium zucineum]|nr:MAG: hypothetical protein CGW95_09645 [Phenylobacterium zucineum]